MNRKIIALLLSALVLPGLGQLYLGRKVVGAILLVLVNILILAGFALMIKSLGPLLAGKLTGVAMTSDDMLQILLKNSGMAKILLASFLCVWGYGVMDLLRANRSNSGNGG